MWKTLQEQVDEVQSFEVEMWQISTLACRKTEAKFNVFSDTAAEFQANFRRLNKYPHGKHAFLSVRVT